MKSDGEWLVVVSGRHDCFGRKDEIRLSYVIFPGDQKRKEWRTNDYMVMSLLINSMLPEVAETRLGARTFT